MNPPTTLSATETHAYVSAAISYGWDQPVIYLGDCIEWMRTLPGESVDAIVCDPPYGLGFMGKEWDASVPSAEWAAECMRVLKPGGWLVAFAATRTDHRLKVAVEDAGFELRDTISWVYYNGFPKSLDIGKSIDRAAGAEREIVGSKLGLPGYHLHERPDSGIFGEGFGAQTEETRLRASQVTAPATPEAVQWNGWGTALKPAQEPAVLARKPFPGTVAGCVLANCTGALNIDGCRFQFGDPAWVGPTHQDSLSRPGNAFRGHLFNGDGREGVTSGSEIGRWPANLYYCPKAGRQERERGCGDLPERESAAVEVHGAGRAALNSPRAGAGRTAQGVRNHHPTVKPVRLMRWLVRLVTPPGGLVVDPFTGSGTTGVAAVLEGFRFAGAELGEEYHAIATARIEHARRYPEVWTDTEPGPPSKSNKSSRERERAEQQGQVGLFGGSS